MSLRHALLALIEVGPLTGYELAKVFDQSAEHIWHAQHSQIYTELRKMEADGLIGAETLPRGEKALATKRAYALTAAGARELTDWVAAIDPAPSIRDAAYVKASYLEYGSFRSARAQFRTHRRHYELLRNQLEEHLELLERAATNLMRRRLANTQPAAHRAIVAYKTHAYRGLLARAATEIDWASEGLRLIDQLAAAPDGPPPDEPTLAPRSARQPTIAAAMEDERLA